MAENKEYNPKLKENLEKEVVFRFGEAVHYKDGQIAAPPNAPFENVYSNPELYIEKGCLDACKSLWDLNITTQESEGHGNSAWIELGKLSDQNFEIFKELVKKQPRKYQITDYFKSIKKTCIIRGVKGRISQDLIKPFVMQDIYEGVLNSQDFLTDKCGCHSWSERGDGKIERVFNKSKQTKSIEEYAKEKGCIYDKEEDKVYLSQFYYDRHLKYLDYIKTKENNTTV